MTKSPSRSFLAKLSLALGLIGLAIGGPAYAESQEELARDLVPSQKPLYDLGHGYSGGDFAVEAWVDEKDLTYRVGDHLTVYVRPKQTSYITVLNVGTSGKVNVIFPNFYQKDTKVRAGHTISIPAEKARWRIDVAGPPGVEVIQVIASSHPLTLAELTKLAASSADSPILSLDRSAEVVARDLVPQLKHPSKDKLGRSFCKTILVRVLPSKYGSLVPPLRGTFEPMLRPEQSIFKIG
jgi:hypothetical protein